MHHRLLAFLLALTVALPAAAANEGADAELQGVWAVDCGKPASPSNLHIRWDFPSDGPPTYRTTYTDRWPPGGGLVTDLGRDADGLLHYSLTRDARIIWSVRLEEKAGRLRVVETVDASGRMLVRDGITTAFGRPTVPFERCEASAPVS